MRCDCVRHSGCLSMMARWSYLLLAPAQIVRKRNFFLFQRVALVCWPMLTIAPGISKRLAELQILCGARIFERPATAAASAPLAARDEVTRIL